jgi:predicted MFS family arabinose efflux permease
MVLSISDAGIRSSPRATLRTLLTSPTQRPIIAPAPHCTAALSGSGPPSTAAVIAVCLSEILGVAGYSIVPALLPHFLDAWSLSGTEGGWLAGMVFAGYMIAVLPLVSITDRVPARTVYLAASALNVISCFGFALADGLVHGLLFRALAGIALAGMYMPGLRALTDRLDGARRARVSAFYITSFTIGASLSFLLGRAGTLYGWRTVFVAAGVLGILAAGLAWKALPPTVTRPASASRPLFGLVAALQNRTVIILTVGYVAVIWGSSGLRQWIVVFLTFCAGVSGEATGAAWWIAAAGVIINLLGVPAGFVGNELAIRFGLRSTAAVVFLVSAVATGLFGLATPLPLGGVVLLSLVAGFVVQGNFANLTTGLLVVAAPQHAGATMALYSSIGFGGGFAGTVAFGATLDYLGGAANAIAWVAAFASCGVICLVGAVGMALLPTNIKHVESGTA